MTVTAVRMAVRALIGAALLASGAYAAMARSPQEDTSHAAPPAFPRSARSNFVERCGGCHGLEGRSVARNVPDLAGRAGFFLCTPESRSFAGRLPNVMFARLSDEDLADVLNYVMFDLGETATSRLAKPYTSQEVATYRANPLSVTDLHAKRREVVGEMVARCQAPQAMLDYNRPRGRIPGRVEEMK
ncbi:c-type cytochrome [Novosphingobium profundi]|uniref:c-type cytochrome n=1 Tax=Novosphingobium profundi TaxID=1774954 RepID=UPI001CFE9993|nr:cytochrome c [Novosphingobium profundi]